jgi:hypothetical protein
MIQDDIINELQYIPESKLIEIYKIIHSFRLKFGTEPKTNETDYVLQNKDLMQQIALSMQTHQQRAGYQPTTEELNALLSI